MSLSRNRSTLSGDMRSKHVLALADLGEHLDVGRLLHAEVAADHRIVPAQERVGRQFQPDRGRQRRLAVGAQPVDLGGALLQRRIGRDRRSARSAHWPACIRGRNRPWSPAAAPASLFNDSNITGGLHSSSRPQPSANSVSAAKAMPSPGRVGDVAGRVAGRLHHRDRLASRTGWCRLRATVLSMPGIFAASAFGPTMRQPEFLLKREVRLDMVAMVMGDQEQVGLPAGALDRRQDRRLLGRVDQQRSGRFWRHAPARRNCRSGT